MPAEFFTRLEAADYARLSAKTIDRRIKAGELPVIRIGKAVRLSKRDLDAWLDTHRVTVAGGAV